MNARGLDLEEKTGLKLKDVVQIFQAIDAKVLQHIDKVSSSPLICKLSILTHLSI